MRRLARHFATEKYYRRPVAGDGIVGLPSWVDYALEGSAFIQINIILAACFTLRGHDIHID